MVLPSRICVSVMPLSVATVPPLELPQAPTITRKATAAANRGPVLVIGLPPYSSDSKVLHSLGIGRKLSTSPFTDSPQPASQPGVSRQYQPDHAVRRKNHDQDQERPVGDGRAGVLEHDRDLVRDPVRALDELAG